MWMRPFLFSLTSGCLAEHMGKKIPQDMCASEKVPFVESKFCWSSHRTMKFDNDHFTVLSLDIYVYKDIYVMVFLWETIIYDYFSENCRFWIRLHGSRSTSARLSWVTSLVVPKWFICKPWFCLQHCQRNYYIQHILIIHLDQYTNTNICIYMYIYICIYSHTHTCLLNLENPSATVTRPFRPTPSWCVQSFSLFEIRRGEAVCRSWCRGSNGCVKRMAQTGTLKAKGNFPRRISCDISWDCTVEVWWWCMIRSVVVSHRGSLQQHTTTIIHGSWEMVIPNHLRCGAGVTRGMSGMAEKKNGIPCNNTWLLGF